MGWHQKSWPALIVPSPALIVPSSALIVPLSVNRFPNKLAPNVPNKIMTNPPFCSFASFLIVSLTRLLSINQIFNYFNHFHDIIHFLIRNY